MLFNMPANEYVIGLAIEDYALYVYVQCNVTVFSKRRSRDSIVIELLWLMPYEVTPSWLQPSIDVFASFTTFTTSISRWASIGYKLQMGHKRM